MKSKKKISRGQTGPRTPEGKVKSLIGSGSITATTKSKTLNYLKRCDRCPLRPWQHEWYDKNGDKQIRYYSGKCANYKVGSKCLIPQGQMIGQLTKYYRHHEKTDMIDLQKEVTLSLLEDAELAKQAEIAEKARPGMYSAKFKELALSGMDSINKYTIGEKRRIEADVTQKVATVDMTALMKSEQDKCIDEGFPWEKQEAKEVKQDDTKKDDADRVETKGNGNNKQ